MIINFITRLKDGKLNSVLEDEGYTRRKRQCKSYNPESLVQIGQEYVQLIIIRTSVSKQGN